MKKKTCEDSTLFEGVDYVTTVELPSFSGTEIKISDVKKLLTTLEDTWYIFSSGDFDEGGYYVYYFHYIRPATEDEIVQYKKDYEEQYKKNNQEELDTLIERLNAVLKNKGFRESVVICGKEVGISVPSTLSAPKVEKSPEVKSPQEENKSLLPKEEKISLEQKYDYMRKLGGAFDMGNVYQEQMNKILKEREELEKGLKKC